MENESAESQIFGLEEQLVAAIIENQNLVEEIKRLREMGRPEDLFQQLEREKETNKFLSEKIREYERDKNTGFSEAETSDEREKAPLNREKPPRSPSRGRFGLRRRELAKSKSLDQSEFLASLALEGAEEAVMVSDSLEEFDHPYTDTSGEGIRRPDSKTRRRLPLVGKLEDWLLRKVSTLLEDFSEVTEEDLKPVDDKGEQLTVRKLKENVLRFSAIMQPLNDSFYQIRTLLRWKSPAITFLALSTYIASILSGYSVVLAMVFAILSLSRNYFRKRGWPLKLLQPTRSRMDTDEGDAGDSKLGDRFTVVLQVARRVQNVLGTASSTAEKLKNLLLWEHEATAQLYAMLWALLVASLVFWPSQLFSLFGVYLGFKLFIVDFLFYKFPRVRQKYDTASRLWDTLPTDADLGKRSEKNEVSPTDVKVFLELFNLPPSEVPLPGWQGGKRCTLVNRDKSLTSAFRNGRLYLTNSHLCFERSKNNPEKNIRLATCDVVTLEKANSYPWIPGGGMAIEILAASGKVYFFGGIINRDEVFDAILDSCRQSGQRSPTKKEKEKEKEKEREGEKEKGKEGERPRSDESLPPETKNHENKSDVIGSENDSG